LDSINLIQQTPPILAPTQGIGSGISAPTVSSPSIGADSSVLSNLSLVAPPVDLDLHQILQGVISRQQFSKVSSPGSNPKNTKNLPTPNFKEVANPQGVPLVGKTFALQAISLASR
jgi:hypothetical protein